MGEGKWGRIVGQAHELSAFVTVLNYRGVPLDRDPLPVESLSWSVDATARPALSGSLVVPLTEEWAPTTSSSALNPFGGGVEVWLEARGSGEFDKQRLGFALIKDVKVSRPNNSINVQLTDLTEAIGASHIRQALPKADDGDQTDWWWMQNQLGLANVQQWERDRDGEIIVPHREGVRLSDPQERISRTHKIGRDERWAAGMSRMDLLDELAERDSSDPSYLYLDRDGSLLVRAPALLDPTQSPTTTAHVLRSGPGGLLVEVTSTVTRDGAINELTVRLDGRVQGENKVSTFHVTGGPMQRKYVGKRNLVEERSAKWSQGELDAYTARRLELRAGARRGMSAVALINPYIKPGDAVEVRAGASASERFTARSVSITLPDGRMTVTGQGWVEEKLNVAKGKSPKPAQDPVADDPPPTEDVDATPTGGRFPKDHKFKAVEKALANGKGTEASVKNAKAVLRSIPVKYPSITTVYGWRQSDPYPDHPSGLALDVMMPSGHTAPQHPGLGNKIVKYLINHQKDYAVDYIIWRQRIWRGSYGNLKYSKSSAMSDRGDPTQNHMDHVHVTVRPYAGFPGRWTTVKKGKYWQTAGGQDSDSFILPMAQMIASGNGYNPPGHPGLDYYTTGSTKLRVIADGGKVSNVVTSNGNMVDLLYNLPGGRLKTRYFHMTQKARYPEGRVLSRGTTIGYQGNTGNSQGAHLHYETHFRPDGAGNYTPFHPVEIMKALRAPIGGPSRGADLSDSRMKLLRNLLFLNGNWRGARSSDVYGLERAL